MVSTVLKQLHRRVAAVPHELQLARRIFSTASRNSNSSAATQHSPAAEGASATEGGAKPVGSENAGLTREPSGAVQYLGQAWDCLCALELASLHIMTDRKAFRQAPAAPMTGPSVGKAAIGGPFRLLNHEGKVVTKRDFVGNWTVVYFGFTFCPVICLAELTKLTKTVDNVEKQIGVKLVPLFISVDPERDTVEQVCDYLKAYHPRLVGLTRSVNDIR